MQSSDIEKVKQERKQVFNEIVQAFETKYSWLGHQVARELLLSAASWNIDKYSNPHMRYRDHVMLAWNRGWLKTSILSKMGEILGDELCSTIGKVTDAAMRGSVASGKFTPPKVLKSPIIISTEFGQTDFDDELLNLFLALLEEGKTNIAMNKVGNLGDAQITKIEKKYDGVSFSETNEFNLDTKFVFWGATYDPSKLQDDAMRSRYKIVTPEKQLNPDITKAIDNNKFSLDSTTIKDCRQFLLEDREVRVDFTPPDRLYEDYEIIPRESRDLQSYMAARNWWGLEVNTGIMEEYIAHLKESRKIAKMSPQDRVFDLIFDNPMTYEEIRAETGFTHKEIYQLLEKLKAKRVVGNDGEMRWLIKSGKGEDPESKIGSIFD